MFMDRQEKETMVIRKLNSEKTELLDYSIRTFEIETDEDLKNDLLKIFRTMFSENDEVKNNLVYVTTPTGILYFQHAYIGENATDGIKEYRLRCMIYTTAGVRGNQVEFVFKGDQAEETFPIAITKL